MSDGEKARRGRSSIAAGFTILEILISVLILSLVMAGLMNVFLGSKRYILGSRWRMTAGELGRYFLEPLSMNVSQNTWSTSWLGSGGNYSLNITLDGRSYTANYNITPNFNSTNVNKVKLNVTWNDTTI